MVANMEVMQCCLNDGPLKSPHQWAQNKKTSIHKGAFFCFVSFVAFSSHQHCPCVCIDCSHYHNTTCLIFYSLFVFLFLGPVDELWIRGALRGRHKNQIHVSHELCKFSNGLSHLQIPGTIISICQRKYLQLTYSWAVWKTVGSGFGSR